MNELRHYLTTTGQDPYQLWLDGLRDRMAKARITMRVNRLAAGAFGDCKPVGEGVWELRMHYGPGYRVYYAMEGKKIVLLLAGGDKSTQSADIEKAIGYWNDFKRRSI